jgi:hypothetical protein
MMLYTNSTVALKFALAVAEFFQEIAGTAFEKPSRNV